MSLTMALTAMSTPRLRSIGFIPAATALTPSRTIAWARMVAVVVPSPATVLVLLATSRTICTPMFSNLSLSSISLATVTPSLVIRGAPQLLSRTTLRPLGPKVTLTASARMSMPCSMRSRASVPSRISLAAMIIVLSAGLYSGGAAFEDAHDVGFLHDHQFLTVEANLGARPFAEQHAVAGLEVERVHLAVLAPGTRPGRDVIALHRLLLGGVGNEDPARRLRFLLHSPDHHTVVQRSEFHENPPLIAHGNRGALARRAKANEEYPDDRISTLRSRVLSTSGAVPSFTRAFHRFRWLEEVMRYGRKHRND